jgi:uncharacterized membrane-anchored protein
MTFLVTFLVVTVLGLVLRRMYEYLYRSEYQKWKEVDTIDLSIVVGNLVCWIFACCCIPKISATTTISPVLDLPRQSAVSASGLPLSP